MFAFALDAEDFAKKSEDMGAALDQMPFALSRALNDAADETYNYLIDQTWPRSVTVRNAGFMRWALRTEFSTKYNLVVSIYDNTPDKRAHLALHASGGVKVAKSGRLAIPTSNVMRSARGVAPSQKPAVLGRKVVKGNLVFQGTGSGKMSKLKLMYVLTPKANQPKDVPFYADFQSQMTEASSRHFPGRMMEAMKTRK